MHNNDWTSLYSDRNSANWKDIAFVMETREKNGKLYYKWESTLEGPSIFTTVYGEYIQHLVDLYGYLYVTAHFYEDKKSISEEDSHHEE